MDDVFISYSRRDKVFTQELYEALTAANRTVWADWDSIPTASDWFTEIKQGIQETDSVLFVLSPEWIKSNECLQELVYAVEMGKRLFPILYLPVDPKDVPPELAKINWVYMRETDDFDKAFQTLCSAMDTDLDWIKTHTRIQIRALEWEKKKRSASFSLRGEDLTEGERFVTDGANKNPIPTPLQGEYVLASRKDATKKQRQTLAGVTVALVVSIGLGIVAFFQRQEAVRQRTEAVRQAHVSRAGELAAQTELAITKNFQNALLLGIESFREWDTVQSRSALIDITATNPQLQQFLIGHTNSFYNVAFSPNGKTLASRSGDGTIIFWDVATHQPIGQPIPGLTEIESNIAFSPDGKTLASVSENAISLWDVETRQPFGPPFTGHKGFVLTVAFSPDGKLLASGLRTIILWDIGTRQPIGQPLNGHSGTIYSVAFSPAGKTLASGNEDGTIILWNVDPQFWAISACERAGRNFTRAEWAKYFPSEEYRKTCEQWPLEREVTVTPTP